MSSTMSNTLDPARLDAFLGRFVGDLGAAMHAATVVIGDRLGLYKALAEGPCDAATLARRTGVKERIALEWLRAQSASGYVSVDSETGKFFLSPEQSLALADPDGLSCPGAFLIVSSLFRDTDRLAEAFKRNGGFGWHEHEHSLFEGTERFFRPNYNMNLVSSWIPSLDGVEARLQKGARVADVGCGHGASTLLMARSYPNSTFVGFDYHEASIVRARELAAEAGLADRATFQVARAQDFPGRGYDLVAFFDCLHDMGDPVSAARHVKQALAKDGAWMVVEPFANDDPKDNLNPVGRLFYSASTLICAPCSLQQEVGLALGAQAGPARLGAVMREGGFSKVRVAATTPFNLVFEARP